MSEYPQGEFLLPLFPLPNLVFFPRTRLPLHVFEPRYRQMVTDALATDERFAIVLLRPGWEANYYGSPPVHQYGTLGHIEQFVALDDGRYNILVNGQVRVRLIENVKESPYRIARVIAEPEQAGAPATAHAQREWLANLSRQYLEFLPGQSEVPELATAGLDSLTNALIMSLNLDVEQKQQLLELGDVVTRAARVADELEQRLERMKFLRSFRNDGDPRNN